MTFLVVSWRRLGLVVLSALLIVATSFWSQTGLHAQQAKGRNRAKAEPNGRPKPNANENPGDGRQIPNLMEGPVELPPTPPQGAWGAVVFANARWMVVQNSLGQQFPIANDAVTQFLIRWPYSLDELTNESIVEAIGLDNNSNTLRTDHIDVFEGSDRNLVSLTNTGVLSNNRMVPLIQPNFDLFLTGVPLTPELLMFGWAFPQNPMALNGPFQLHAVGGVVGVNPLRLRLPGNQMATVLPGMGGNMTVTQVTRGNSSFAEKGDLVFLMPVDMTPRSVLLSQVVLYKKVLLRQFRQP